MTLHPDVARINETVAGLQHAHERRRTRIPQPPTVPQFRTLASGEVINSQGQIVFRAPVKVGKA